MVLIHKNHAIIRVILIVALLIGVIIFVLVNHNVKHPYEWVLNATYDNIYDFKDGKACAERGDNKWMIHSDGALTEIDYDKDYDYLKSTLKRIATGEGEKRLYGVENLLGETILETKYMYMTENLAEYVVACEDISDRYNRVFTIFDKAGNAVSELSGGYDGDPIYYVYDFVNGYAKFNQG